MKLTIILIIFGVLSMAIGIYQILDDNVTGALLSALYSIVFFASGAFNFIKTKK